jgi:hypothetical protein
MGLVVTAWIWCIAGLVVVTGTLGSVIGTLVVPRRVDSRISRVCEYLVDGTFRVAIPRRATYETRDRVLAWQAPITLLVRLLVWLTLLALGFGLVLLPSVLGSAGRAFSDAGSSLFTLGYAAPTGRASAVLEYLAAFTGLVVVGLQVGYLPTLYAAFNRRETAVSLLAARAGAPAWGPEILARTRWGIFDGDPRPVLDELFSSWEGWAAEVAESHTTYFTLARLRSPQPFSDWLTSLVAVLDAAALHLSLTPSAEPKITARLSLRMGFETLDRIARAMRLPVPAGPDPDAAISVSYDQFCAATAMLRQLDYPIEVTDEVAWPNFRGWRANYDITALLLARELDATPAMWTGTRRWPSEPIPPRRPALRKAGGASPRREPPRAP